MIYSRQRVGHDTVDWLDHQVLNINRRGNTVLTQGFQHHRADSQIRRIVIITDVKVYNIGTGSQRFGGVFTERQNQPTELRASNRVSSRFSLRIIFLQALGSRLVQSQQFVTFYVCAEFAVFCGKL